MQQWECIVCGWVYDEEVGDPDSGIAPGTKFEDIPDDWLCPECGVGKDDFELVDIPDTQPSASAPESTDNPVESHATHSTDPVVIIGSGMAGYGLLKELRKLNPSQAITLICADDGRVYSKPALSTGYTKNTSGEDLTQATAVEMALKHGVNILTNTHAAKIDCANKVVMLGDDSGVVRYSKLVLATGANCIECRLEGNAIDEVYTINDLRGFELFRARAEQLGAKKIAIIGAGLIGCEYANDLLNGGYQTISVDPLSSCLPTLIPEAAGRAVQTALEEQGAEFRFGNRVVAVNSSENGLELTLDDGSVFAADMVLSAIGVVPNIKLAAASGLSIGRGIKTNEFLETSQTDVYALGDCAEVNGLNLVYVSPLVAGYKALARTLSGQRTAVTYPAMPVSVKTPACPVTVCPPPLGSQGEWVTVKQDGQNVHMEYENPQGETFGFALTGDACKLARELTANLPNWLE